MPESTAGT